MWFATWHPDPTLIAVGSLTIHWYGFLLALGAWAGYLLINRLAKTAQVSRHHLGNIFLLLIVSGLIGGRLYHVLNEIEYYAEQPGQIFAIWNGGLAIHGALLAGGLALWWYVRRYQLGFWRLADVLVPGLALGQAIGRWGNFFNQELFGRPTELPWAIPIDPANRPASYRGFEFFHPTFLYESIGNLMIAGLLVLLLRRRLPAGTVATAYLAGYALLRIIIESFRIDRTPIVAGIRLPILFSLGMILAATLIFIVQLSRRGKSS